MEEWKGQKEKKVKYNKKIKIKRGICEK